MVDRRKKVEELMEGFMSIKYRTAHAARAVKCDANITPAQWGVVMYLRRGTCTIKDIAAAFSITGPAATQLVNGLVKNGYVVRESDRLDRRMVLLTLSKEAKGHMETMRRLATRQFLKIFKVLNDKEFEQYCVLHKKIVTGFTQ